MEPSQSAFTIPSQLSKRGNSLLYNANPGGAARQRRQNVVLDLHKFRNFW